ncbi:MAG: hypothetical protein R3Y29_00740 [bacterium]
MRKYFVTFLITSLFLTSCNSNKPDSNSTSTSLEHVNDIDDGNNLEEEQNNNANNNTGSGDSEDTTSTTINSSDENDVEIKPNINILTKDFSISYNIDDENFKESLLENFKQNLLIQVGYKDIIRLEFFQVPAQTINIKSFYIKNNQVIDSTSEDIIVLDKSDNLDMPLLYDLDDLEIQAVIYIVEVKFENSTINYSFAVEIDRPLSERSILEEDNSVTGYLSNENQELYDKYKISLDKELLVDLTPFEVIELFIQANKEYDYKTAYSLIAIKENSSLEMPSESEYIESFMALNAGMIEEYIVNLEATLEGEFIQEGEDSGYISYETRPYTPLAFDLIKQDGVWLVQYFIY